MIEIQWKHWPKWTKKEKKQTRKEKNGKIKIKVMDFIVHTIVGLAS